MSASSEPSWKEPVTNPLLPPVNRIYLNLCLSSDRIIANVYWLAL